MEQGRYEAEGWRVRGTAPCSGNVVIDPIHGTGTLVGFAKRHMTERRAAQRALQEAQLAQSQKLEALGQLPAASRMTSTTCG
jgi:hypothetical protein